LVNTIGPELGTSHFASGVSPKERRLGPNRQVFEVSRSLEHGRVEEMDMAFAARRQYNNLFELQQGRFGASEYP